MTAAQNSKFWFLIDALKQRDCVDDILSNYGVQSVKDLDEQQVKEVLDSLEDELRRMKAVVDKPTRKKRSEVLNLLTEMGVYDNSGSWERVNAYLKDPRIAGKLLYMMSIAEMDELITKLRSIRNKQVKQKAKLDWFGRQN